MKNGKKKIADLITVLILPVLICLLWQLATENNLVNKAILPGPARVWASLIKLAGKGALTKHIISSLKRVVRGYFFGSLFGLGVGLIAALSERFNKFIRVPVGLLRPIPPIALIPFFILWMGIGEKSKTAVIVFGSFWPVLLNTIQGIRSSDPKLLEVGRILEKDFFTVFRKIILPSALPSIFTGLRLGMSSSWSCLVAAEMIAASSGIGFLISYSREMAQPASMFVGIAIIGCIGLVLDLLFTKLNSVLVYWHKPKEEV